MKAIIAMNISALFGAIMSGAMKLIYTNGVPILEFGVLAYFFNVISFLVMLIIARRNPFSSENTHNLQKLIFVRGFIG